MLFLMILNTASLPVTSSLGCGKTLKMDGWMSLTYELVTGSEGGDADISRERERERVLIIWSRCFLGHINSFFF